MALTSISNLKSALGGGSRPNLFEVGITFPTALPAGSVPVTNYELLCKATSIPAMTVGSIEVPVRGRSVKVPGDRTFAEWSVTFLSDAGFTVRKKMEEWSDFVKLNNFSAGTLRNTASAAGDDYYGVIRVKQLNESSDVIRVYTLNLAFPVDISALDVSYDTTDALQEFTTTFQYSYFTTSDS